MRFLNCSDANNVLKKRFEKYDLLLLRKNKNYETEKPFLLHYGKINKKKYAFHKSFQKADNKLEFVIKKKSKPENQF